jgi:hypothetical protein
VSFSFPYPGFLIVAAVATVLAVAMDFRNRRAPFGIPGQVAMSLVAGIAVGALVAARSGLATGVLLTPLMAVLFFISTRIRAANRGGR